MVLGISLLYCGAQGPARPSMMAVKWFDSSPPLFLSSTQSPICFTFAASSSRLRDRARKRGLHKSPRSSARCLGQPLHFSLLGVKFLQVFQVVRSLVAQISCLGPPSIRVRSNRCTTCSIRFSAHDDQIKRESNLRSRAFSAQGRARFPYNLKSSQNPSL